MTRTKKQDEERDKRLKWEASIIPNLSTQEKAKKVNEWRQWEKEREEDKKKQEQFLADLLHRQVLQIRYLKKPCEELAYEKPPEIDRDDNGKPIQWKFTTEKELITVKPSDKSLPRLEPDDAVPVALSEWRDKDPDNYRRTIPRPGLQRWIVRLSDGNVVGGALLRRQVILKTKVAEVNTAALKLAEARRRQAEKSLATVTKNVGRQLERQTFFADHPQSRPRNKRNTCRTCSHLGNPPILPRFFKDNLQQASQGEWRWFSDDCWRDW